MLKIRTRGLSWREVDGEVIALDLESSAYFSCNRSGAVLWRALVEGAGHDDLIAALENGYGVTRAVAATDVSGFLELLRQHSLLESP